MLPDRDPRPARPQPGAPEVEPISPEAAEAIMKRVVAQYTAEGWQVLSHSAYDARLTRGARNLDIRVDLLGDVQVSESGLTPLQDSGRLTAWMLLLASLLVALALGSALGLI